MTEQTFFDNINGKKIYIAKIITDPNYDPDTSTNGWYYVQTNVVGTFIVYLNKTFDSQYNYTIHLRIEGYGTDTTCCNTNPISRYCNNDTTKSCVQYGRYDKTTGLQLDNIIPIEVENGALLSLPLEEPILVDGDPLFNFIPILLLTSAAILGLYILFKKSNRFT